MIPALDFALTNHGSICVLQPLPPEALEWVELHIPDDAQLWGKSGVVIEPRYVDDILAGIADDGLLYVVTNNTIH